MPTQATETVVNTTTANQQSNPHIATLPDGGYIITWISFDHGGDASGGIYFQRYNAAGQKVSADGLTLGAQEVHVNTYTADRQYWPRIAVMPDGKFMIVWNSYDGQDGSGEGIYAQLFGADGAAIGSEIRVAATTSGRQADPQVSASDDGFVVTWASSEGPGDASTYRVYAQKFDEAGAFVAWDGSANGNVRAQTLINTSTANEQGWNQHLQLADGRLMVLYGSRHIDGTVDAFAKIFNANGTVAKDQFQLNTYMPSDQLWPNAVELADGRIVVIWTSNGQDGSGWGVYGRILSASGDPLTAEFRINTTTGDSQSDSGVAAGPQLVALEDGGFVVSWHSYDASGNGAYYQRFDAEGDKVNGEVLANSMTGVGWQSMPTMAAVDGGFVITWQAENLDGSSYGIASKTIVLEDLIAREGGEDLVNTATNFNQRLPQIASAEDGSYVIVWYSQSTYNSGDGSGWGLFGQRYGADGQRLGTEFRVADATAGDQGINVFSLAMLGDGKFVVVWDASGAPGDGDLGTFAKVFNADGTTYKADFLVNTTTAGEQAWPSVTALQGANDGEFLVSWRTYFQGGNSYDIWVQRFDETGTKVGSEVRVTTTDPVNADGSEHQAKVIGLADGGWLVAYQDDGQDGWSDGVYAKRYDANGNVVGGTNPDGSPTTGAFRVNVQTAYSQYLNANCLAALDDGGFVVTFSSQHSDQSNLAVWAQIYNSDGTLRAAQFRVNTAQHGEQADPQVTVLNDGSFVVVWTSQQIDSAGGWDVYAKRFAADGSILNEEFKVDTIQAEGDQRWPSVAATPEGFVVTWEHESTPYGQTYDGNGGSIWTQRFTIDGLNATAETAHRPTLSATAAQGAEDTAIDVDISAALSGSAVGTESLSLSISGIPVGATVSDGTNSFTATAHDTGVDVTGWTLANLTVTPPANSEADFTLYVRATSTDSATGDTATNEATVSVVVDARADGMEIGERSERINTTTAGEQLFNLGSDQINRSPIASWDDGSYVVVWQSSDGSEWGVYGQRYDADGQPVGTEFRVNIGTSSTQGWASVETLSSGGFVVTWGSWGQVAPSSVSSDPYYSYYNTQARVFDANGVGGAETQVNTYNAYASSQFQPDVVGLSDGGYLIVWSSEGQDGSGYGIYAQRYNASGQAVSRSGGAVGADEFRLNATTVHEQSWPSVTGLPGGGFVAVWNSNLQDGSNFGTYLQRFDAAGAAVGGEVLVNQTTAGNQFHPAITTLADGGYVVLWQSDVGDGSSWGAYARVFNANGTARTDEFRVNTVTANDQSKAQAVALEDGGFFIAWHGQGQDMYGYGVFGQRFSPDGDKVGGEIPLDGTRTYGEQTFPFLTNGADGSIVAVWQGHDPAGDGYWGDGSGWGVFGRRIQLDAEEAAPTGGESQVNTKSAHDQSQPSIATLEDGSYVIVWTSAPSRGTGDISSNGVFAQRFGADGVKIGGEFTVNTTLTGDQSRPQVVALEGGGYVVVWHSSEGDGSAHGVFAQRFEADGDRVGGEFQVNSNASGAQGEPQVAALQGANAGGFVVTWNQDSGEVEARVFDANGVAVGADILVNVQNPALNFNNSSEYLPSVAATADGGFVIVWRDNDSDGHSGGVFGQRYSVNLATSTVTPIGGTNPDGSPAANNFRINFESYGWQYDPKVAALAGGGFVVVFMSDVADSNAAGLVAQIYNAAGGRVGTEFVVNTSVAGTQAAPEITTLSDGSFVVVWQSDHNDGNEGYDVFFKRFAADGRVLNEEMRVNTHGAGFQGDPTVAEVGDGFTVVWTSTGQDGSANGVFQQHFTFDRGPNGGAVADRPNLSASDATGDEDTAIDLDLSASLVDTDGSETLRVEVSDIPVGATLSDGTNSFTATAADRTVDVAGWNLANLAIAPAADADADFTLQIRAQSRETSSGDVAWNTDQIRVTVNAVAEPQADFNDEFLVNTQIPGSQYDPHVASFADGSFIVVWTSDTQPGGSAEEIVARRYNADGSPQGAEFIVNTYHGYYENRPDVTVLDDGGFIVAWTQLDASGWGVFAQRYDDAGVAVTLDGTAAGGAEQINSYVSGDQYWPEVTALADGGWIVTWQSHAQDGAGWGIYAKRFAADGSIVQMFDTAGTPANEVRINAATAGDQQHVSVVQLAGGGFAFKWDAPDGSGVGSFVRLYDASGHPITSLGTDGDFRVNTTTANDQGAEGGAMAALADGGFVVTWHSWAQDGSNHGVYAQVYNADGSARGGEFRASSYAYDSQQEPKVTSLPDGGFMVVWTSQGQDGSSWGVYGQRFDASGDKVGAEFRLNELTGGDQSTPNIIVQADGSGIIVVYEGQDDSGYGVYGKRIPLPDAATELAIDRAGTEQQVNTRTADHQTWPAVTVLADGSYVVTWQSHAQDGSSWGVYAKHFDSDGDAIQLTDANGDPLWVLDGNGDPILVPDGQGNFVQVPLTEFRINDYTNSEQRNVSVVALEDGGFMVAYQSYGNSGAGDGDWGVYAKRYDADMHVVNLTTAGGQSVSELLVNAFTSSTQEAPRLAALADGSVVVTYQSQGQDGSNWGVYSHRIDANGQLAAGADVRVNTTTTDQQIEPEIAALTDGGYVITWSSYNHDGSDWGIYGQRFDASGAAVGQEFLVNTLTDSTQIYSSVAGLSDGGFVIVWQTYTGADADGSDYGIAGQRYDASGNPVGGEFLINGVAYNEQSQPTVVAAPDGGFVVAFTSLQADGSSYGVVARRFDAEGQATEPYGDDVNVNTYTLGNQSAAALAMLERGFVAVWHSDGQDGSGWSIQMQRFQGQGLEPPPLIVDAALGNANANDLIFATIQEALDAATDGDTVIIKGGTYNLSATATVDVDDLHIRNAAGETVIINGPAGGAALEVGANLNISLRGDAVERLVFNGGAGSDAAVDLLGSNSGTEILRVTINANGDYGLRLGGGQNGVNISDSVFGGDADLALVLIRGVASGVAASSGVNILDNLFSGSGGSGLVIEASGSQVLENVFSGDFAEGFAALVVAAAGGDLQDNSFSGPGAGAWFYDLANAYAEATFIGQNAFPAGWTWVQERNGVFSTLEEALSVAQAGDTIQATAGDYSGETGLTVADDNLKINAPSVATGIELTLAAGVTTLTLNDASAVEITGNGTANIVYAGSGADSVFGLGGNDQLNGRDGNDDLQGGAGDDTLTGGGGDDTMAGGADNDRYVVSVNEGHDTVTDASGTDVLALYSTNSGGNDQLVLSGSAGSATATFNGDATANVTATGIEGVEVSLDYDDDVTLTGAVGATSVTISGGVNGNVIDASGLTSATAVTFTGGRGADSFTGSAGSEDTVDYSGETDAGAVTVDLGGGTATDTNGQTDTLSGVENAIGTSRADSLTGSSVANRLEGGAGNDSLAGGGGRDSFVFRAGFGADTISDFNVTNEYLRFDAAVFATVADVLAATSIVSGNTVINAGGGNTITLTGVTGLGAWNIDILGTNDAPTLRATAPSATLREVGQGVAGTASSSVTLTPDDVDGTVSYDAAALGADGWVESPAGVWTKIGTYGQAVLTVASNSLVYSLDNARAATQGLQTGQTVTETFTVPAIDNGGLTVTRPVVFSIGGSNDAPVGVLDTGTAVETGTAAGSNATGNVLTNDTDVDTGDGKSVSAFSFGASNGTVGNALNGAYGALTLNADGTYSYAIDNANATVQALRTSANTLTETFSYTVRDTAGATSTTSLTITIQGANDAPVAVADTALATEAGTAAGVNPTGNVLTNDTDVDSGDAKTVSAISGGTVGQALNGTYGALTLNADGSYSYAVNNANAAVNALRTTANTLTDSFTYTVQDTAGATSSTTLTITIRGANDAPVANADTGTAVEAGTSAGSNGTGNVLTNDTDVDAGDSKSVNAVNLGATNGTVGQGLTGLYGTLTLNANGTWTYVVDNANATVQALRTSGETLSETFGYRMRDGANATSSSTLTVTIQGANDAPVGVNDSGSATEAGTSAGSNATGNVLTNDTDVDTGDSKTVSAVTGGTVGSALNGTYGALTLNADGSYSYAVNNANGTVNALATGQSLTDSFTYTVSDTAGATSTATLTVTINGANDAPVGVNDSGTAVEAGVSAGSNASGNVLTNDTDVDSGDAKTVSAVTGGTVGSALNGTYGALTLNANGTYTYVVNNANAAVNALRTSADTLTDSFTYTVRDTAGATSTATLTVTVQGANDAPIGNDDAGSASLGGGGGATDATGNVLSNDTDVDSGDGKTVSALAGGTVGSALAGQYGSLTLGADGGYTYVIDENDPAVLALGPTDSISETFTYTVRDTAGATDTAVLTITVFGANEAPVATADTATAVEDGSDPSGNVLTNDTDADAGDTLTVSAIQGGTVGQAVIGTYGTLTLNADGSYGYVLDDANASVNGLRTASDTLTDTFTYTVRDVAGATDTATLTVTVQGANDAPIGNDDSGFAEKAGDDPATDATGNVLSNDTDVDTGDAMTVSALSGGTVGTPKTGTYGTLTLNANGSYVYVIDGANPTVAALTPGQTISETFTYTVRDTDGATDTAVLTITVSGANASPTAVADTGTAVEDGAAAGSDATGNVLTNDTDADLGDGKTVTAVDGGVVGGDTVGAYGTLTLNADGSYVYVIDETDAAVNALRTSGQTLTETFTYTMADTVGETSSTTLTITIQGANDAPEAANDTGAATDGGPNGSGNVLTNDTDVDAGDARTVSAVTGGSVGSAFAGQYGTLTLNANGSWTYVVNGANAAVAALGASQTLTDSFTYTVSDTAGATDTASLDITVSGINDAPVLDLSASRGGPNYTAGFGDSTGAVAIVPTDAVIDDPDDTLVAGATIRLTNFQTGDRLAISNATALAALGITASAYNTATGVLTLSGSASEAAYAQALNLVTFNNTQASPPLGDRIIQISVTDGLATSNTATSTIQVVSRITLYGGTGADNLSGNVGGDTLWGRAGDDTLRGMDGADLLNGEAGLDKLYGGNGNDRINGGDDNDTAQGDAGDDVIYGDAGDDRLLGGDGNDDLRGGLGSDILYGGNGSDTLRGEAGDDTLNGDAGGDKLYGGDGADHINGGVDGDTAYGDAGDDTVSGADGDDLIYGGAGLDKLYGGNGVDRLYGGDDDDVMRGDAGNDALNGDGGNDQLFGGLDNDTLNGGLGADFMRGEAGDDRMNGGDGDDDIAGADGTDVAFGGAGVDLIKGDAGDDQLSGDAGADKLYGGDGADKVYGGDDGDLIFGDAGDDYVLGQAGDDTINGGAGLDRLYGGDGVDTIRGGDQADYISGDAGADALYGDAGDDRILGGDGDDTLSGGMGIDTLTGGLGADRFVFSATTDSAPGGADRITDFNAGLGDLVDLTGIDAKTSVAGNQAFVWASAFTGVAGQAVLTYNSATKLSTLLLDNNGDGAADFELTFTGNISNASGFLL